MTETACQIRTFWNFGKKICHFYLPFFSVSIPMCVKRHRWLFSCNMLNMFNNWIFRARVLDVFVLKSGALHFSCLLTASAIPGGYYCRPNFLQFKEFELYWGAVFLRSVHIFMIFEVKLESWFLSRRDRKWSEKASLAAWIFFALIVK